MKRGLINTLKPIFLWSFILVSCNTTPNTQDNEFHCSNSRFSWNVTYDSNTHKKSIEFYKETKPIKEIQLPIQSEVNGFSLNYVRSGSDSLIISVEYGSGNYFQKVFIFKCKEELSLVGLEVKTFDKSDPNDWNTYDSLLADPVPLSDFDLMSHITF